MCLVCFINAEEYRSRKGNNLYCAPADGGSFPVENEQENEEEGDENHAIHYFAIGSMTNTTALSLRELTPISSQPAMLEGHRLLFRGSGGMATAEEYGDFELVHGLDSEEYPFPGVHGVLHLLSAPQMKILDDFEGGYNRKVCTVTLYDNITKVQAYVYKMDRSKWKPASEQDAHLPTKVKHEPPTERYLDIIAQGCAHHGVLPSWVQYVRQHQCVPRVNPQEFSSFSKCMTTARIPIISWEQVRYNNGLNGLPLWIVINNKVLEFAGDVNSFFPFGYFVKNKIGGTDFTVKFAKGFFEPKYVQSGYSGNGNTHSSGSSTSNFCKVTTSSELSNEHRAWIEDQFANPPPVLASSKWTLVGVVEVVEAMSDAGTLTRNSTFGMRRAKHISFPPPVRSSNSLATLASSRNSSNSSFVDSCGSTDGVATFAPLKARVAGAAPSSALLQQHSNTGFEVGADSPTGTAAGNTPIDLPLSVMMSEEVVLDLTGDINQGYNHFFVGGASCWPAGCKWIVPDGTHPGQTLYIRKTATENYQGPIYMRIKNQDLSIPNRRSDFFILEVNTYYLSWCWDGEIWFLEQEGKGRR
jgi:hypothetical protein